jgi:tRNA(Ile)-lysidine synthase
VSGGIDSVALLQTLVGQGFRKLIVLHLDHGLRGRAGAGDAAFVRALARRHGLPVITARADVAALARDRRLSIETAAREARYAFFARAARETHCRTLVLAHHANDRVETFLFNLLRGGGSGLPGMLAHAVREVEGVKLEILRPWLGVWRAEIEAYAAREKLRHREDASNASVLHTRNRLRTRVLPMLSEEMGRDVRQSLWRAAEVLGAQQEWIDEVFPVETEMLSVATLRGLPAALQRHAIHHWLRRQRTSQISFMLVEAIRALLPPETAAARVNLPGGKFARRRAGVLFIDGPKGKN